MKQLLHSVGDTVGNTMLRPPRSGFGLYHNFGPRSVRRIALTFDDGPSIGSTEALLSELSELRIKATFFCIGEQVRWNPAIVRAAFSSGHVIGNHSMSHRRVAGLKLGRDSSHIEDAASAISDAIGHVPALYRPPWGWLTPWEAGRLRRLRYHAIGWDILTNDWITPEIGGRGIAAEVLARVQGGSIVVMHDSYSLVRKSTKFAFVEAVHEIVNELSQQGYEFVTIPELLDLPAYRMNAKS